MNYNMDKLKTDLVAGPVTIKFIKANGEMREMRCTLSPQLVPQQETETKERRQNPDVQAVWDLDKEDWRSFRYDSLLEVLV
jgi:hypothetical protein